MSKKYFLLILSSSFLILTCFAQPGTLDLSFNQGVAANATVKTCDIRIDGKILIGGSFTTYNGVTINRLVLLNQDGSIDNTFSQGTGADATINTCVFQPDDKIIIGGDFTTYNGTTRNHIARVNWDWNVDNTFNPGTGTDATINICVLQPDGKIIIGGEFTTYNGTTINRIARLNADGSLDSGFDPGTGANGTVNSCVLQTDGKIIIGGEFTSYNGTTINRIARLNSDGSLDTGFNPGTGADNSVFTCVIQSDSKIIIGGSFTTYNGTMRNSILRLNEDGSLDNGFDPGTGANATINTSALQTDGKIIIGGEFTNYNGTTINHITRLNADGSLDTGFNSGTGTNNTVFACAIQSDGEIIIGGEFTSLNSITRNYITRLNADGSLHSNFNYGTGASQYSTTIKIQNDGKIIIGGDFTSYNGTGRNRIARLNADGNLDTGFNPGSGANENVYASAIQSDGKIIICGEFTTFNGTAVNRIARLNPDGSLDNTFAVGTGANNYVDYLAIQSDGKIIVVGAFTTFNGVSKNCIVRLNTDGSIDTGFNMGTGTTGVSRIFVCTIQSDGKIIIGGGFTNYNGTAIKDIARLNQDGSLDISFNPGTGLGPSSSVWGIAIQNNGKIIITGNFTSFNGTLANHIARLNADGSLDANFNAGTGANNLTHQSHVLSDGKIIIVGGFTSYNNIPINYIARLNTDGSLDQTFDTGTGPNGAIYGAGVAIQPDGKIIIAGSFTSYNGISRNRIVRINGDNTNCNADFNLYPDVEPLHYLAENLATGTAPLNYVWDWGDGSFDNIAYPSHTYDVSGSYTICLTITDANNCTDTYCNNYTFKTESPIAYINVIDPLTVGITQSEKENGFVKIYPNPATNTLTIETESSPASGENTYQLQDITGKVLLSGLASGETKFSLDISTYQNGLYILTLIGEEKTARMKIVKQ